MLFQPTNIIPDTRTGIGYGTVDVTNGLQISWQVNGDYPVMTAFQIVVFQNNASSTQLYDTGRLTTGCPFYGRDSSGEIKFFAYTIPDASLASAGITNGNEYKLTIRQYYTENGAETSILQSSASVFVTRDEPYFNMSYFSTVDSAEYTFSWNYAQSQGDTIEWIRYRIKTISGSGSATLYDSGNIYGAAVYECTYSGFVVGQRYAIRADGQTSSGVPISTDWREFSPSYSGTSMGGSLAAIIPSMWYAAVVPDDIVVSWSGISAPENTDLLVLYRSNYDENARMNLMTKVAEMEFSGGSSGNITDFGAASGQGPYTYYLFAAKGGDASATPATKTQYLSTALVSNEVNPAYTYWALIEGSANNDGSYQKINEFLFANNLDSSAVSNNNNPNVMQNFTAFPTIQLSPSNYKSGALTAMIGTAVRGEYLYDTKKLRESILSLSTTKNTLFLKSPKGDVMTVAINGAITFTISETVKGQPQSVTVPWAEIDDAPVSIVS